jgi:hypothetical protein
MTVITKCVESLQQTPQETPKYADVEDDAGRRTDARSVVAPEPYFDHRLRPADPHSAAVWVLWAANMRVELRKRCSAW